VRTGRWRVGSDGPESDWAEVLAGWQKSHTTTLPLGEREILTPRSLTARHTLEQLRQPCSGVMLRFCLGGLLKEKGGRDQGG
jgi:hypothetical protein